MLGFYDPKSLTLEGNTGRILFINARDADDVHVVEFATAEEARRVEVALDVQKTMRITTMDGAVIQTSGLIVMSRTSPNEGVIQSVSKKITPFFIDFDLPEGSIPQKTRGTILGYEKDGAIMVDRIAVLTGEPVVAKNLGEPQMEQRGA